MLDNKMLESSKEQMLDRYNSCKAGVVGAQKKMKEMQSSISDLSMQMVMHNMNMITIATVYRMKFGEDIEDAENNRPATTAKDKHISEAEEQVVTE